MVVRLLQSSRREGAERQQCERLSLLIVVVVVVATLWIDELLLSKRELFST